MKQKSVAGFFGRIWSLFFIVILLSQLATVAAFLKIGMLPVTKTLGVLAVALVDATDIIARSNDSDLMRLFSEGLARQGGIDLIFGDKQGMPHPALPDAYARPGLYRITMVVLEHLGPDASVVLVEDGPTSKVWIHKSSYPAFSLGIPFQSQGLVIHIALGVMFMILILAISANYWLGSRLSTPLKRLAVSARRLIQQKPERIDVPKRAIPEIRTLAEALHQMQMDLDQLLKDREVFLAGVSHDLRMPLARLRLALEMLPQSNRDAQGARDDVEEMSNILEQIVELARLDLERSEPWKVGDINVLLNEMQGKFRRAGLSLGLDLKPLPEVRFKPLALHRLLYNLIDNGWRHGSGEVRVRTVLRDQQPVIIIQNVGCNDPSSYPVQPAVVMSAGGSSGLGLAIVNRLSEVNGIEISAVDLADGGREVTLLMEPVQGS